MMLQFASKQNVSFCFAAVPELVSPVYSTCSLFIFLQTNRSRPSDQCTLPLTFNNKKNNNICFWFSGFSSGHLAGKKFSVGSERTSPWLSCIINSFFKPTYFSSGSHGAGNLSQQAPGGRVDTLLMQPNTQFHTYWQSLIMYSYY